jgi:hypothetical protein
MWKKAIRVGPLLLVPIHAPIAKELRIDETSWLEEIPTSEGILLKVSRCSQSLALPRETAEPTQDRGV